MQRNWNEKKAFGNGRDILGRNFHFGGRNCKETEMKRKQRNWKLMDAKIILVVEICIFFRVFWQLGLLEKVKCQLCGNRMQVIKDLLLQLYLIVELMGNEVCNEGHRNELRVLVIEQAPWVEIRIISSWMIGIIEAHEKGINAKLVQWSLLVEICNCFIGNFSWIDSCFRFRERIEPHRNVKVVVFNDAFGFPS